MTKRVTVPEGSIALILPTQLASELFSLASMVRHEAVPAHARRARFGATANDKDHAKIVLGKIASDLTLALIDAGVTA